MNRMWRLLTLLRTGLRRVFTAEFPPSAAIDSRASITPQANSLASNPATGLPMLSSGVDAGANPYGLDLNDMSKPEIG